MDASTYQLLRSVGIALAAVVAFGLERWRPFAGKRGSARINLTLWLADLVVTGTLCGTCLWGVATWAERAGIGLFPMTAAPAWVAIPATIVLLDLLSYGWHRANHRVRALWRFHAVHHTDPTLTVTTALRFHPGELVLALPVRLAAVACLGAPPVAVVVFEVVFALANLFEHGDVALPPALEGGLARVVVTPALHRRHHDAAPGNRQRNFGTVFTWWDRAFGTYGASTVRDAWTIGVPELPVPATIGMALALPFGWSR